MFSNFVQKKLVGLLTPKHFRQPIGKNLKLWIEKAIARIAYRRNDKHIGGMGKI